jgi:hypothetical protein
MHSADSSKTGQPPGIPLTFGGLLDFRNAGIESNFESGTCPLRHPAEIRADKTF